MKIEYINPFIEASFSVLEMVFGAPPEKGKIAMQPTIITSQQCNVVFGVTGQVQGYVIYGMSLAVASCIAGAMLDQPITEFDQLAASAVSELGNMICGNALMNLSEAGFVCDISPPTIMKGQVEFSMLGITAVLLPLKTPYGELSILMGLQRKSV